MTVFDSVRRARAAERLYRDHARELEQELARVEGKLARVEALLDNPRKLCPCVSEADLRDALQGGDQ